MLILRVTVLLSLLSVAFARISGQEPLQVSSPDGQIVLVLSAQAVLSYSVDFHGKRLIDESELGLDLQGQPPFGPGWRSVNVQRGSSDDTYSIPVGKTKDVRNHYNSLTADFSGESGAAFSVEVRAFDDGVAFRYIVPEQPLPHQRAHYRGAYTIPLQQGRDPLPAGAERTPILVRRRLSNEDRRQSAS
jgi:alpha-glucosidase